MDFTFPELREGVKGLCKAAMLNIKAYSDDIIRALIDYDAPVGVKNAFGVVLADPSAERNRAWQIHEALRIFMHKFMADYGLWFKDGSASMDKRTVAKLRWRQALVSTLLGEVDVALIEEKGKSIRGEPGTAANERFNSKFYGLRRRLFVHEDFVLPTLHEHRAKRGMSIKYIANFGYCRDNRVEAADAFYESLEAAVTLAGASFNIVDANLQEHSEYMPDYLDEFMESLESAVGKGGGAMTKGREGASKRLHGLLTKSSNRLFETLGLKVESQYAKILGLQRELREREQGAGGERDVGRWQRRDRHGPIY